MTEQTERYQILEEIGRGGFAVVYRAHDTQLDRPVALKELHPHLLGDTAWVERFRREARLIARLNHPHIVAIHDIGQASGRQFLIMSLVEGPGLDKLLAGRGRLPWVEALEIIQAVAEGLDYAHSQQILHRDLKPANILMDPARGPLLSDFGLAKLVSDHSLSQSGSIVGTPHYIPPEIWDGEPATPQADIYALGCILYELLTGARLFGGNTPPAIMMAHFRPLILPKQWPEGVPTGVAEVLNVALAKQPKDRYATAGEMVKALVGLSSLSPAPPPPSFPIHIDWGEAPDVITFYGREAEAEQLTRWLVEDRCRLVAILGMGGLGKTTLVTHLADQLQAQFDYVIWRSLRNAPPLEEVLEEWLLFLSDQQVQALPSEVDKRLLRLLEYLRQKRCLLILDNVETLLHEEKVGHYRPGYEVYGHLVQRVGETRHQSCLVLTSREKPAEFIRLEGDSAPVRSLRLPHLAVAAGRALLQDKGLAGPAEAWQALSERYSGNPLALKVVAETIRELFNGDIGAFLAGDLTIFGGIRELLAEQFDRLSTLEQELMIWLAIEREAIGPEQLQANLVQPTPQREMLERLRALRRRSLLERSEAGFTLQNVVMEYVTDRLVETASQQLIEGEVSGHLNRYALLKAQAKEYVRASQARLILQPIVERLQVRYGSEGLEARLKALVVKLRQTTEVSKTAEVSETSAVFETSAVSAPQPGYAGGNLLNLLLHLKSEVNGLDFSGLSIWQAYLQGMRVQNVNFSQADLNSSVFTNTFGDALAVAFSPDGRLLAAGTADGRVWVWRVADGQLLLTCEGHTNWVYTVCFSPDGQTIASGSSDQTIRLWEASTGRPLQTLLGHTSGVVSLSFSPDGQRLASSGGDYTIRLWDVANITALDPGHCLNILKGHTGVVRSVYFNPDGRRLAGGSDDQTIRLWDIANTDELDPGQGLTTLRGHTNAVESICFSPDGQKLASGSADQTIRLWDVNTSQCFNILEGHTGAIRSVSFSPDGQSLASGSADQTIHLWDIRTGQGLKTLQGHTNWVASLCFSPDGQTLASGSADQTVRLWDVRTGQCLKTLHGYINIVASVCFSPDGQRLASGHQDQTIRLWDVANAGALEAGQSLKSLQGHRGSIRQVCFSPDGQTLASGSDDWTLRLWDVATVGSGEAGQCLKILKGHTGWVWSVCFSPDGRTLASGGQDQSLRLWNTYTGQPLNSLKGHTGWIWSVCFSPDGQTLASGSQDRTIRLWNVTHGNSLEAGQCLKILEGHTSVIDSVCFSPNGRFLASGSSDQTIRLWDSANAGALEADQCLKTLEGHTATINSVCFSPDGRFLASGSDDRTIRLWDVANIDVLTNVNALDTGQCLNILEGHTRQVYSVCFSPDGQILASGSDDETIKFWDVETGACLKTLRLPGPYQGMNIAGAVGLSEAQRASLKALGAISDKQG